MDKNNIYIALKLIEGVYKQGLLTKRTYKNILNDYSKDIDITEFLCYIDKDDTVANKTTINLGVA